MASPIDHKSTEMHKQQKEAQVDGPVFGPLSVALRPPLEEAEEDWLSQASYRSSWLNRDKSLERQMTVLKKKNDLDQTDNAPCMSKEQCPQMVEIGFVAEVKKAEDDLTVHLCSKHGKRMKSILQECSEEERNQDLEASLMQLESTPPVPHPPLLQSSPHRLTSTSPHNDSSSTNISLFSQPESFSYLSVEEERQVLPLQLMPTSQTSPEEENNCSRFSRQKSNISLTSSSPERLVQLFSPSLICSIQPSLCQTSSSSTNISSFPENSITQKSSLTEQESSPISSFNKISSESSYHQLGSSSPSPASSAAPAVTLNPSQNDAQACLESSSTLTAKPRLSSETQAFLLVCKWLQPQVKLHRLSQHECHQATLPNRAPVSSDEEDMFDVNLLYSASESDTQDSDDSDYVPSKRRRYR